VQISDGASEPVRVVPDQFLDQPPNAGLAATASLELEAAEEHSAGAQWVSFGQEESRFLAQFGGADLIKH